MNAIRPLRMSCLAVGILVATQAGCVSAAANKSLTRAQADALLQKLWTARVEALKVERAPEMQAKKITLGDKVMPWEERQFGEAPMGGRSLWISMHGGGGAPKEVNDDQWRNQIGLYKPAEGIYVAPRAPTDNWNLWHEAHIDPMFDRMIEDFVALRGVNPDRVYIMGYSAGGDGVWQLAPRMSDRLAGAAMMAGHPNESQVVGLRNLAFACFVGGRDSAYNRNKVVAEKAAELDRLQKEDPEGYVHMSRVYPECAHWMNLKDAEALPWLAQYTRKPWPKKIVWLQDDVTHPRFYWLAVPPSEAKERREIRAEVDGQTIKLTGDVPKGMMLRLSDELVNLDQPIRVLVGGNEVFQGKVPRQEAVIRESLVERADPRTAATAKLVLQW